MSRDCAFRCKPVRRYRLSGVRHRHGTSQCAREDRLALATAAADGCQSEPAAPLPRVVSVLDEDFQASVPRLFLPSWPSTQDFGPFFGFVAGVPAAAGTITAKLLES
jgi:hypothetical protein